MKTVSALPLAVAALLCLLLAGFALGQELQQPDLVPGQPALTNGSIIKMLRAGLGEDVILSTVKAKPAKYATGVDDLIALKGAGVTDKIITAMIERMASGGSNRIARPPASEGEEDKKAWEKVFGEITAAQERARTQQLESAHRALDDCTRAEEIDHQSKIDHQKRMYEMERERLDEDFVAGRISAVHRIKQLKLIEQAEYELEKAELRHKLAEALGGRPAGPAPAETPWLTPLYTPPGAPCPALFKDSSKQSTAGP